MAERGDRYRFQLWSRPGAAWDYPPWNEDPRVSLDSPLSISPDGPHWVVRDERGNEARDEVKDRAVLRLIALALGCPFPRDAGGPTDSR